MRILINAPSAHVGGGITYIKNLVQNLLLYKDDSFLIFLPEKTLGKVRQSQSAHIQFYSYPFKRTTGIQRHYFDQLHIPWFIRKNSIDLLFNVTGFGTFFSPCPQVLLLRNSLYFDPVLEDVYDNLGSIRLKHLLKRKHQIWSMKKAEMLLFPTETMRNMVDNYLSLSHKKAFVLHYGIDAESFNSKTQYNSESPELLNSKKNSGFKILLNVSTYAVHKNFETLIKGLSILLDRGEKVVLATTTSPDKTPYKSQYSSLKVLARNLGVEDFWIELGYIPYDQIHAIYNMADLYVFPSLTESFGHSLLEAMVSGLPIIASDTKVNKEIAGDAAVYFDTFDPADCAQKISGIFNNKQLYNSLCEASETRVNQFSWRDYTHNLMAYFYQAVGKNNSKFPHSIQ